MGGLLGEDGVMHPQQPARCLTQTPTHCDSLPPQGTLGFTHVHTESLETVHSSNQSGGPLKKEASTGTVMGMID